MLRIKAERLRRGWNQTVVAYRARMSGPEISRIETGRTQPYPRQLARLSKVLGLSPAALMQEIGEPTAGNPDVPHEHR